jgi:hypothetical protein
MGSPRIPGAEVVSVGDKGHRGFPTGLAPETDVERSSFELGQLQFCHFLPVQACLDVTTKNALTRGVGFGEPPHDEVVEDRGDQLSGTTLFRPSVAYVDAHVGLCRVEGDHVCVIAPSFSCRRSRTDHTQPFTELADGLVWAQTTIRDNCDD